MSEEERTPETAEEPVEPAERSALLDGMALSGAPRQDACGWSRWDLRGAASDLCASDLSRLEKNHQRFAREAGARLSALLRQKVRLESPAVRAIEYAEFLRGLSEPSSLYVVHAKLTRTRLLVAVTPRVLLAMVERLLGGPPAGPPPADRALTSLEDSLARTLVGRLLDALDETWTSGEEPIGFEIVHSESNPRLLQVRLPDSRVVHLSAAISLDGREAAGGDLEIAVEPGPLLERLSRSGAAAAEEGDAAGGEHRAKILESLAALDVEVTFAFSTRPLPLAGLLALKPGDMVDTGVSAEGAVDLRIAGRTIGRGRAGLHEGRIAVRLE